MLLHETFADQNGWMAQVQFVVTLSGNFGMSISDHVIHYWIEGQIMHVLGKVKMLTCTASTYLQVNGM